MRGVRCISGADHMILRDKRYKALRSTDYNYDFDGKTGYFARWGHRKEDDPDFCRFGPEILDIEVTTSCHGPAGKPCAFCYKANTPDGQNMSLETFKNILDRMPHTLTQCAFGADAQCKSNPDIWKMMDYCRNNERNPIVPNITVADIDDNTASRLAELCGAVAVSRYSDKNICYDSVNRLVSRSLKQTNIHIMISEETFEQAMETLHDYKTDDRLTGLNAIVLLSLKTKGRGKRFNSLNEQQFSELVNYAFEHDIPLGFDSCSAPKFIKAIEGRPDFDSIMTCVEPCESSCFSAYINVEGTFWPCSFCEEIGEDWKTGIDVLSSTDFLKDVWNNPRVLRFREKLLKNGRCCPLFEV